MNDNKKSKINENCTFFSFEHIPYELTKAQKRYMFLKRFIDIIFSLFVLILLILMPVLVLVAIKIKLTSKESIIFLQKRVGQYGKIINIYKFRTMTSEVPENKATNELNDADKYITKFGKFLRATSFDEVPQLLNVLKGDMSLVGPRPLILNESYIHELRKKNGVYLIKPGITGLAQINGRDYLTPENKVAFDTEYLHTMSFLTDIKIFFKSIIVVLKRENTFDSKK